VSKNWIAFNFKYPISTEADRENQVIIIRYSYPFFLGSICIVAFLIWQWKKLKMLAQKIRNDKVSLFYEIQ